MTIKSGQTVTWKKALNETLEVHVISVAEDCKSAIIKVPVMPGLLAKYPNANKRTVLISALQERSND